MTLDVPLGTVVRDAIRAWKQKQQKPFLPLSHKPGEAQFDFGEAKIIYRGREMKAAFFRGQREKSFIQALIAIRNDIC